MIDLRKTNVHYGELMETDATPAASYFVRELFTANTYRNVAFLPVKVPSPPPPPLTKERHKALKRAACIKTLIS